MYDDEWVEMEPSTGLEPYTGRPTASNQTLDAFMSVNGEKLAEIAEGISVMNRAERLAALAKIRYGHCAESTYRSLVSYFSEYGGWNRKSALAAVEKFEKNGFESKAARDLAMFARGMFFDDRSEKFQAINCVGLGSCGESSQTAFVICTFEDTVSGNQFALYFPFTEKEQLSQYDGYCVSRKTYPCYMLVAPSASGFSSEYPIAKSYDIRAMRVEVEKFVKGGCSYTVNPRLRTVYRKKDSFYSY